MRYAWLSVLVVFLDQFIKLAAPVWGPADGGLLSTGPITVTLLQPSLLPATDLRTTMANSTTLVLLAGLLTIHLLVTRWSNQFHFISSKTLIALQLAGGGITSQAIDLAFRGTVHNAFQLGLFDSYALKSSIADVALMAGFFLLLDVLLRGSSKVHSRVTLAPANIAPLNFNHLPRGIDNIHIDVHISPRFRKNTEQLIQALIPLTIRQLQQGKRKITLPPRQLAEVTNDFSELLDLSLKKAKESGEKQLPNLFFIAILKFIHGEVNNAVAAQLQNAKEGNIEHTLRGLKARTNASFVEWLFRYREHIIALACSVLMHNLFEKKGGSLEKHVKHFLGQKRLFALQALDSPMVLAESPTNAMIQMDHYLVLGQQQNAPNSFVNIDTLLADTFSEYLGLVENSTAETGEVSSYLRGSGGINSNTIDTLSQPSVLMNPGNIAILLDSGWSERKLKKTRKLNDWRKYNKLRQHLHFQRRLQEKLQYVLKKSGLATWIVATYQVHELLKQHSSDISPSTLIALLARRYDKNEFLPRLRDTLKAGKRAPPEEEVIKIRRRIQKEEDKLLDRDLLRFMHNFSHYRRDLLLLLSYQRAAAEINLLTDPNDIETSRANYTLYEFLHRSEISNSHADIHSHIILKADLRGSTEVTEKLTELELNPATHFERNFFSPINKVIDAYGAEKVFIEGDAIILILNEHAGESRDRLIAARACGLASRILKIVAKQNRELSAYGLPELELGIGIAYQKGAPRYLFDNQHRITISPAINRADRLSACTWSIRRWRQEQGAGTAHVEVYQPSESAISHGEKAQKDMVFNLNGILLEPDVFQRINKELTLKKVNNSLPEIQDSTLYAIHFPDLAGVSHSLIIRKAPVHTYNPDNVVTNCPVVDERNFYEIIWREELLDKLRKR